MKFWWRWLLWWLLLGAALRTFMLLAYPADAPVPGIEHFAFGLINDTQAYLMIAGAVALLGLAGDRWVRAAAYAAVCISLVVLAAEVFFWLEFESRLDRLVFHYLAYPKEVLVFLEDQFFLSLFVLPLLLLAWLLMRVFTWPDYRSEWRVYHWLLAGAGTVVLLVGAPLGQSYSRVHSGFVSSGYLGVLTDARYREDDIAWLAHTPVTPGEVVPVSYAPDDAARQIRNEVRDKKHVVLIVEESFAGPVWEDAALRARFLPNFTALAAQSINFTNLYASGSRTTRGMEALLNGFPPLPGISTTQRAHVERLPSLARAMQDGGFYPVFLYGGWPDFSSFSEYWRAVGFQRQWSRLDFDEAFETSWGVADGALLERLVREMDGLTRARDKIFLATLTVSHHRPYDFPAGQVPFPADARRSEYAMAYADHALGRFFEAARQSAWYDDTLFIIAADHGPHPRGDTLIPADSYRIPLVMHGAGIAPRDMAGLGSSVSLPKTLVSMLGIRTDEAFHGADLLCDCDTVVPVEAGYHIGLLAADGLHVLTLEGDYVHWPYGPGGRGLLRPPAINPEAEHARQRIVDVFAPAYRWYYQLPAPAAGSGVLTRVHHADVAGE